MSLYRELSLCSEMSLQSDSVAHMLVCFWGRRKCRSCVRGRGWEMLDVRGGD